VKDRKLATRYARALLASLPEGPAAEEADRFLGALSQAMDESDDFRGLMFDPAVPSSARKSVLRSLAEQANMPVQVGNFLATIVDHSRASSIVSIAEVFHGEREKQAGIVAAEITTAWPLTEDLKQRTLQVLEQMTGRKVRLTAQVQPEVLGGAVTRVGSEIHDGSLKTQLDQLRRKMTQE